MAILDGPKTRSALFAYCAALELSEAEIVSIRVMRLGAELEDLRARVGK